jgi:thiol-disulfide isomerase/thioredoxin
MRIGLAIGLFCLAFALILQAGLPQRADYTGQFVAGMGYVAPEIGALAPPLTGQTLAENLPFSLEQQRGKTVILNFWATWCVPCQIEMPLLQLLQDECPAKVQVIGINAGENPALVADWLKTNALTFVILIDNNQQHQTRYRVLGLPSTYVISPTGKIDTIFYGAVSESALRATLADCTVDNP